MTMTMAAQGLGARDHFGSAGAALRVQGMGASGLAAEAAVAAAVAASGSGGAGAGSAAGGKKAKAPRKAGAAALRRARRASTGERSFNEKAEVAKALAAGGDLGETTAALLSRPEKKRRLGKKAALLVGNVYVGRSGKVSTRAIKTRPELFGQAEGPTDPVLSGLLGERTCHSCHYRRALVIDCEWASLNKGRHSYCANCLRRRMNVDFHAIRCGFIKYHCPVCEGMCPCSACKKKNGGVLKEFPFEYARCVDVSRISIKSGG